MYRPEDGDLVEVVRLASRLFAREIDQELYRILRPTELIDQQIRELTEERALEELAAEYCRLFLGPNPLCPPYESIQRGKTITGGQTEQSVRAFLETHGLQAKIEPPILSHDHLAVELAALCRLLEPPLNKSQEIAENFHRHHINPWVPDYLQNLASRSQLAPYQTIAKLMAPLLRTNEP